MPDRSLKIGFALEGNSDYNVIPVLVKRYLAEKYPELTVTVETLRPNQRGYGFVKKLPEFAALFHSKAVSVIVAVVDTDVTAVGERRRLFQEAINACGDKQIPVCVSYGLSVRSLESWLMSDITALKAVFQSSRFLTEPPDPESISYPKRELNRMVQDLTDGAIKTYSNHADEIARQIDLNNIQRRCKHFSDFLKEIDSCMKPLFR